MRLRDLTCLAAAAAFVAWAAPAMAREHDTERRTERAKERVEAGEAASEIDEGVTTSVSIGLGVTEFAGNRMDDVTDLGASFDARVMWDTGRLIGFEAAYFGTRQSIDALGANNDSHLNSHSIEGMAKLDLEQYVGFEVGGVGLAPFAAAGLGAGRYDVDDIGAARASFADTDWVVAIPTAVGLGAEAGNWIFDARLAYRFMFDEDLLRNTATGLASDASLNNWNVMARAGLEF